MWISGYVTGNSFSAERASVGEVRSSGGKVSVSATAEHRDVATAAPYGVASVPPIGSRALVLPTDAGRLCLGVIGAPAYRLAQGELMLYSSGGASIVLKNDGSVQINGNVQINGRTVE